MYEAICHLKSTAPYSVSKFHETPKLEKESHDAYEIRTWRERIHVMPDGRIFLPPMSFKLGLAATAKRMGEQIPGKGKSTYTKHFVSGVSITEPIILPYKKDEVAGECYLCASDGVAGSGKKVKKWFCVIPKWEGDLRIMVLDETITHAVLVRTLEEMGKFNGIGRFRPQTGGYYGRFVVTDSRFE
jgi:hypothetical protein